MNIPQLPDASHPEYALYNPLCTPDWRCQRAQQLYAAKRRPTRWDDTYIRTYLKFLRDFDGAVKLSKSSVLEIGNAPDTRMLADRLAKNPGLWYACRIYRHGDVRTLMEADILAKLNNAQIAKRSGGLPETVDWYEKDFF